MDLSKTCIWILTIFPVLWITAAACPAKCTCSGITYNCGRNENITESDLITIFSGTTSTIKRLAITNFHGDTLKFVHFRLIPDIEYFYILDSPMLTTIEKDAFNAVSFQSLTVSKTGITTLLDGVFQPIKNYLTYLELEGNELTTLSDNVFNGLTNIQNLNLNRNQIETIAPAVFTSVKSATIQIQGNPFDCSCDASVALWEWLNADPSLKIDIQCSTPLSVSGKSLQNLNRSEICPPTTPGMTSPAPEPLGPTTDNVTPAPAPALPDWAIVLIIAGIFTIMFLVSGILCQLEKRRYYAKQKGLAEQQQSQQSSVEEVYQNPAVNNYETISEKL